MAIDRLGATIASVSLTIQLLDGRVRGNPHSLYAMLCRFRPFLSLLQLHSKMVMTASVVIYFSQWSIAGRRLIRLLLIALCAEDY